LREVGMSDFRVYICPNCQKEVTVEETRNSAPVQAPAALPPVVRGMDPNLRRGTDCGKEVSIHAESCPYCGATFAKNNKKHAVFFYVAWGVVSLIATGLILIAGMAMPSGLLEKLHRGVKSARLSANPSAGQTTLLTVEEKAGAQAILATLLQTKDQVTGTTFLKPHWADTYDNQIYLYIGISEAKATVLRLKIEYEGKDMLVTKKLIFRIDDTVEEIEAEKLEKKDYVAGNHREWFDEVAEPHLAVLLKIARGNKVLMQYQGRNDSYDRTLNDAEKATLGQMLLVYRYLKEQDGAASLRIPSTNHLASEAR
jgi:DNA-directed RNA polymerase subunit RPC12/RpoP